MTSHCFVKCKNIWLTLAHTHGGTQTRTHTRTYRRLNLEKAHLDCVTADTLDVNKHCNEKTFYPILNHSPFSSACILERTVSGIDTFRNTTPDKCGSGKCCPACKYALNAFKRFRVNRLAERIISISQPRNVCKQF